MKNTEEREKRKRDTYKIFGIILSFFLWTINSLLIILRTKYILVEFGNEVNGVAQTANQIFSYFVLFEGGMSTAYLYKMYQPMAEKRYKKVAELYSGLTISMRHISIKMLLALIPVSIIGAHIIALVNLNTVKATCILILTAVRFIIPYYCNISYKVMLNIHDKNYIVDIIEMITNIIIVLWEIVAMKVFHRDIIRVLLIGIIMNITVSVIYKFYVKQICIQDCIHREKPDFQAKEMSKDVVVHQISGLINMNIDILVLSATNIAFVTCYQGYMNIVTSIIGLVNRISNNYKVTIGLAIAEEREETYILFQRILSFHMFAAMTLIPVYVMCINDFIKLWIGEEYILNNNVIYIIVIYIIMRITCNPVYYIADGAGLYGRTKRYAITDALINLILSVIFASKMGVFGVILATVISYILTVVPGYTKIIYKEIFEQRNTFILNYFVIFLSILISVSFIKIVLGNIIVNSWIEFIIKFILYAVISMFIAFIILIICKYKYWKGQRENI